MIISNIWENKIHGNQTTNQPAVARLFFLAFGSRLVFLLFGFACGMVMSKIPMANPNVAETE